MGKLVFCLVFLAHQVASEEVIIRLSAEDYARMPPKFHLDHYEHCLHQPGGVYCTAHANVVADGPSELLDMMRGYSAYTLKHHNYTRLRYGLCMTRTCRQFYDGTAEPELQAAAEACLNNSLSRSHGLKSKVTKVNCYFEDETKHKYTVDWVDWAVAAVMFAIVALNVIGSAYDFTRDRAKPGNKFLLSFACRVNWNRLVAPPSPDPNSLALQSLNGVRFLTCLLIIFIHVPLSAFIAIENPDFIEKSYDSPGFYLLYNGTLITQSFFLMSGFLLAYKMQISTEKQPLSWKKYLKSIFLRFTRLAPLSFLSLMLTATWLRFTGYGPLWQEQTGVEVDDCRNYWYYNVLFVNNFFDVSSCNLEAWSTASDFHLHILGLTVLLLAPHATQRRVALALLYAVGVLWPAYNIITMDLDGTVIARPETSVTYGMSDNTFHYVYKRTYANIPMFVIGMTFGFLVYDLQKRNVTTQDHTKWRYLYWLLVPVLLATLLAGGVFYGDGPRASLPVRVLFASLVKPLFGLSVMLIIFGAVNKVEAVYRGVLEWRGFGPLGRLSYGVYALHMTLVRYVAGTRTTLVHYSLSHAMHDYFGMATLSVVLALLVHLAVEAPATQLVKVACATRPETRESETVVKDTKTE
ncbi:hypothetical protein ABMA27_006332 [Loxostege sticticalis]|uniref:Acyltransferase 3 domain-containing protein n=1 Tax=Loxostege sticticalis TaxID=481309 RepID=A0ABR3HIE0_LOXSC